MLQSVSRTLQLLAVALLLPFALVTLAPTLAAQSTPLAIQGYDPVAYFTLGKPTLGVADIEFQWDEQRYRFATAEHRALFKANPGAYAPRFGNLCAMALSKGEVKPADPRFWLISDGKLYLFGEAQGPERFLKDPAGALTRATQNEPKRIR